MERVERESGQARSCEGQNERLAKMIVAGQIGGFARISSRIVACNITFLPNRTTQRLPSQLFDSCFISPLSLILTYLKEAKKSKKAARRGHPPPPPLPTFHSVHKTYLEQAKNVDSE
jgi:hypothetical protein